MMTPKFNGRPRSLEPAVVLAWLVSCRALADSFSFGTGAGRSSQPVTVVLMNTHLETLGVHYRVSPFAAASSTSTRRAAEMLPPLERARWPHNPMVQPHARVYRARQQGSAGKNLQGRAREGVARSQRPARRHSQHRPEHPKASAGFSRDGPTTRCRRSRRCITTQQHGPTSSAPMSSGQTSSLLPHRATSQARSSSIAAAVWRWSSADACPRCPRA